MRIERSVFIFFCIGRIFVVLFLHLLYCFYYLTDTTFRKCLAGMFFKLQSYFSDVQLWREYIVGCRHAKSKSRVYWVAF
jgi:hypothetical protein